MDAFRRIWTRSLSWLRRKWVRFESGARMRLLILASSGHIAALPCVINDDRPRQEEAMQYALLIYQGNTPLPSNPEAWATLSEDDQKAVYSDYNALNKIPGVTP